MTIKTKLSGEEIEELLGKRIEGEALENLVSVLGKELKEFSHPTRGKWVEDSVYGRYNFSPVKEGIDVDLYLFTTHVQDTHNKITWKYTDLLQGRIDYEKC